MQLVFEHLTTEQTAEHAQSDAVRLVGAGLGGHIIVELAQEDARNRQGNEQHHHGDDILITTRTDGDIDELLAEPDHDKSQHHLCDTHHNAYQGVPPDTHHVSYNPKNVAHDCWQSTVNPQQSQALATD